MELLLLRHGKAEPHGPPEDDAARALVEKGRQQSRNAAAFLKNADLLPDIVLTSPLARALQTAEEFCQTAAIPPPVVQPWLTSGMHPQTAAAELAAFRDHPRVMIVGHEPDFSSLIEWLVGGGPVEVKKGALVLLEVRPPTKHATLRFLIPPRLMSR